MRLLAKLSFPFQPRLETRQDLLPLFGGGSTAQTLNKGLGFAMDSWSSFHCNLKVPNDESPSPTATPFAIWVEIFNQSSSPAAQHCRAARGNISSCSHLPEDLVQGPTCDHEKLDLVSGQW